MRLPDQATPLSYALELTVRCQPVKTMRVSSPSISNSRPPPRLLWLNADGLAIVSANLVAGDVSYPAACAHSEPRDFVALAFDAAVPAGRAILTMRFQRALQALKETRGIFKQLVEDGDWYAYTQFEAVSAAARLSMLR